MPSRLRVNLMTVEFFPFFVVDLYGFKSEIYSAPTLTLRLLEHIFVLIFFHFENFVLTFASLKLTEF